MKAKETKISLLFTCLFLISISAVFWTNSYAQKLDTNKITLKSKIKPQKHNSNIKGSVQTYEPKIYTFLPSENNTLQTKNDKILVVNKIYPIPLVDQLNINFKLTKDNTIIIKITDLLGNEVSTLSNEKLAAGEYAKTYNLPTKLNPGIYFLRIVAGGEPIIKRISVI